MKKYLFYFAFETPEISISNRVHNDDLEISEYFYISAVNEVIALTEGTRLANEFLSILHKDSYEKVLVENFAYGLLDPDKEEFENEFLESLPYIELLNEENRSKILKLLLSKYIA